METGVALPRPEEPRRVSGGFQSDSDFRGDRDRVGALEYHGRVATWDANPQDHDVSHRPREALVKPSATPGLRGRIQAHAPRRDRARRFAGFGRSQPPTPVTLTAPGFDARWAARPFGADAHLWVCTHLAGSREFEAMETTGA